jgi:hypothetical protein
LRSGCRAAVDFPGRRRGRGERGDGDRPSAAGAQLAVGESLPSMADLRTVLQETVASLDANLLAGFALLHLLAPSSGRG